MESYLGDSALFLGNGIHRTEKNNGISWGDLLKKYHGVMESIQILIMT